MVWCLLCRQLARRPNGILQNGTKSNILINLTIYMYVPDACMEHKIKFCHFYHVSFIIQTFAEVSLIHQVIIIICMINRQLHVAITWLKSISFDTYIMVHHRLFLETL